MLVNNCVLTLQGDNRLWCSDAARGLEEGDRVALLRMLQLYGSAMGTTLK